MTLLLDLAAQGVTVSQRDGQPVLTGETSSVTPEQMAALKANKAEVLARLGWYPWHGDARPVEVRCVGGMVIRLDVPLPPPGAREWRRVGDVEWQQIPGAVKA